MRVPSINPRQQRADRLGRRNDEQWFRDNPSRCYRVRLSLPFEMEGWRSEDHLKSKLMLVIRPDTTTLKHVKVSLAGDTPFCPDDEKFLTLLWSHIQLRVETATSGTRTLITREEHAELLRMAGFSLLADQGEAA